MLVARSLASGESGLNFASWILPLLLGQCSEAAILTERGG